MVPPCRLAVARRRGGAPSRRLPSPPRCLATLASLTIVCGFGQSGPSRTVVVTNVSGARFDIECVGDAPFCGSVGEYSCGAGFSSSGINVTCGAAPNNYYVGGCNGYNVPNCTRRCLQPTETLAALAHPRWLRMCTQTSSVGTLRSLCTTVTCYRRTAAPAAPRDGSVCA
jgi:hypothetical protein